MTETPRGQTPVPLVSRKVVLIAANAVLVRQNWSIGKLIVEGEQKGRRFAF